MKRLIFLLFSLLVLASNEIAALPATHHGSKTYSGIDIVPSTASTRQSTANFKSTAYGLDAPQISFVNSTVFDWWYFDCISADLKTSLVVVFYTALPSAFPFLHSNEHTTVVGVYTSFPNGTAGSYTLNATEAAITSIRQGSSGSFAGTGASWVGSPDLSSYHISINSPQYGIVGTFKLKSVAPAHYPCEPVKLGSYMKVGPSIGWSNALPDADGEVDFTFQGSRLKFKGVAYHDKNWSDQPIQVNVASWYWGHARLGTFPIDYLTLDGTEVRPSGANSQYPPTVTSGNPEGYQIVVDLRKSGLGELELNVTKVTTVANAEGMYTRSAGIVMGEFTRPDNGILLRGGVALLEEFVLVDDSGSSVLL